MLQLHFIAEADWSAAITTDEHLYPLPGCKKTTKHNGLITVFIARPPNQLQNDALRGSWQECLTVVKCLCVSVRARPHNRSSASEANSMQSRSDAQPLLHGKAAQHYSVYWRTFSLERNLNILSEFSHLLQWPAQWRCMISPLKRRRPLTHTYKHTHSANYCLMSCSIKQDWLANVHASKNSLSISADDLEMADPLFVVFCCCMSVP